VTVNSFTEQLTGPVSRWLHRDRVHDVATAIPSRTVPDLPGGAARIRRRQGGDVDSCARILRGISSGGKYPLPRPASHRGWLCDDVIDAWVAERRGIVLGHVAIARVGGGAASTLRWREVTGRPVDDLALVSRFFVRLPERGHGIGTALLAAAVAGARARGMVPVADAVNPSRFGAPIYGDHGWRLAAQDWFGAKGERRAYLYVMPDSSTAEPDAGAAVGVASGRGRALTGSGAGGVRG
jgi:GNAT superfamily N-acetyltransferase